MGKIFNFSFIKSAVDFAKNNFGADEDVFAWKNGDTFRLSKLSYPLIEGDEFIYKGKVVDFTELVKP